MQQESPGLDVKIVTPMGTVYTESNIKSIRVTTESGEVTIHPRHIPLISLLAPGEMVVNKDGSKLYLAVSHGVLEVKKENHIVLLADRAEHAEVIDFERAEQAKDRAEVKLKEDNLSEKEKDLYTRLLEKEENRVLVSKRHKERKELK